MINFKILLLGFLLIFVTTIIHTFFTKLLLSYVKGHSLKKKYILPQSYWVAIIVIILLLVSLIESGIWAFAYIQLEAVNTIEEAIYFSLVSFTTLGFGDITLGENMRLLAAIEAANGILLFGWSTAIVVAVVQGIYFKTNN